MLLISYYYPPAPEVGGKRAAALAEYLRDSGFEVHVTRGINGPVPNPATDAGVSAGVHLVSVRIPRKLISEAWLAIKPIVKRLVPRRASPAAQSETGEGPVPIKALDASGYEIEAGRSRIHRHVKAFERLFDGHKLWGLRACLKLLLRYRLQRFDFVITTGPPFIDFVVGAWAAKCFQARLVLDYRDPWILFGTFGTDAHDVLPLQRFQNRIAHRCVARSAEIVVVSPGIERHLREYYELGQRRVELIRNGYDDEALIAAAAPTGRLEFLYAGTLYLNRNPFPFLEALAAYCARAEIERGRIRFTLVGNCAEWRGHSLTDWVHKYEMGDVVRILSSVPGNELRQLIRESNVLINFAQGQPLQIPAKSFEYIASGRDVITFAEDDSDVAQLFREAGVGHVADPSAAPWAGMFDNLYRWYVVESKQPKQPVGGIQRFSRRQQLQPYIGLLEELAEAQESVA